MEIDRLVFSESEIGQAGRSTDFQGDQLRLAFFDGLRERPEGFEASANQEPELVVVSLNASSDGTRPGL